MRVEWVASSLALYLRTRCIQQYYCCCAHLGCQQSTELTPPTDLNGLVRFVERRNLVSAHVLSHFYCPLPTIPYVSHVYLALQPQQWTEPFVSPSSCCTFFSLILLHSRPAKGCQTSCGPLNCTWSYHSSSYTI